MAQTHKIAVLAGDGIGPEITEQALRVLTLIEQKRDVQFDCQHAEFGASAYFSTGKSFPDATIKACDEADAILKGPIGLSHEESEKIPVEERPERGALLPMRRRLNTYANFRPISLPKGMAHFSPLKADIVGEGIDILLVRELVGGLYFGGKERGGKAIVGVIGGLDRLVETGHGDHREHRAEDFLARQRHVVARHFDHRRRDAAVDLRGRRRRQRPLHLQAQAPELRRCAAANGPAAALLSGVAGDRGRDQRGGDASRSGLTYFKALPLRGVPTPPTLAAQAAPSGASRRRRFDHTPDG